MKGKTVISGEQIFVRERLIVDPATGKVDLVFRARAILKEASAEVVYRRDGTARRLSLAGPGVAYGVGQQGVSLSRSDDDLRLDWHLRVGEGSAELWVEATNVGQRPLRLV